MFSKQIFFIFIIVSLLACERQVKPQITIQDTFPYVDLKEEYLNLVKRQYILLDIFRDRFFLEEQSTNPLGFNVDSIVIDPYTTDYNQLANKYIKAAEIQIKLFEFFMMDRELQEMFKHMQVSEDDSLKIIPADELVKTYRTWLEFSKTILESTNNN